MAPITGGSTVLAFGEMLAGAVLLDYGAKAIGAALNSAPGGGVTTGSDNLTKSLNAPPATGTQKAQVQQVASEFGLSPQSIWGVYGTESSFGSDPSTSSAGAQGPFQFLQSTWATYGHGGNIQSFSDALPAAARLLKSLGANSDPNSPQTRQALNNYNGNRGGTSVTSYVQSVLKFGGQF